MKQHITMHVLAIFDKHTELYNQQRKKEREHLESVLSTYENAGIMKELDELMLSRQFLDNAYGITSKRVNEYHLKLYHDEYDGWFDWYHTRGTLIANRNGGATNIGKYKGDEDCALAIVKHIRQ